MADIIKYDMTDIWATSGDVVAPDSAKIRAGWAVEVVPRQWWNWFENRQDQNIAYMLQKGFPEWDATTEYILNKSYVQRNGIVYKATATSTNSDPILLTSWVKAFADYSVASAALGSLTPSPNQLPYFTGSGSASTTTLTPFARTILDDADDAAVRSTISAQQSSVNLTSLSAVTAVTNGLPYFTGTTAMGITSLTAFGRSFIGSSDAIAARTVLGVDSAVDVNAALAAGLATKQPLSSVLTTLSTLTPATNKLPYFTGTTTAGTTDITAFSRTLLDDIDAATARTTLEVDSSTTAASNLSAGLATRQPLNANLTATAAAAAAANTMFYWTSSTVVGVATLTPFARTILDDADAVAVRSTLSVDSSATVASNLSSGLATKQPLNANLTTLAALSSTADTIPYFTGANTAAVTTLTTFARTILDDVDDVAVRATIGADNASNLTTGVIPLSRIPTNLTGVNSATATKLATARLINGVAFDGSADVTLPSGVWGGIGGTLSNQTDLQSALNAKSSFGVAQAYQNFTGSRALSTTYTNSTTKPITIIITTTNATASSTIDANVGGAGVMRICQTQAGTGPSAGTGQVVVPAGATYVLTANGAISQWWEFR